MFTLPALDGDCTALILDLLDKGTLLTAACTCREACGTVRPRLVHNVSITQLGKLMHFCHFVLVHNLAPSIYTMTIRVPQSPRLSQHLGSFCDVLELASNLHTFVVQGSTQALTGVTGSPRIATLVGRNTIPLINLEMAGVDPSGLHILRSIRGLSSLAFSFASSWNPRSDHLSQIIENSSGTLTELCLQAVPSPAQEGARWVLKADADTTFSPCMKLRKLTVNNMDVDISYLADRFPRLEHLTFGPNCLSDTTDVLGRPLWPNLKILECNFDLVLALGNSDLSSLRRLVLRALPQSYLERFMVVLVRLPVKRLYLRTLLHCNGPRDISVQRFFASLLSSTPALQVLKVEVYGDEIMDTALNNFVFTCPLKTIRRPKDLKYLSITSVINASSYHISFMLHHDLGVAVRWFQAIPSLQGFSYGVAGDKPANYIRACPPNADGVTNPDDIKYSPHPSEADPGLYVDYMND